jgi:hypothetical protein
MCATEMRGGIVVDVVRLTIKALFAGGEGLGWK